MVLSYIAAFFFFSYWKYQHFLYNGIDLAIFNQVFWNASEGRWYVSSLQGHSYLGDHWSLFIPFLVPVYAFAANFLTPVYHPLILLLLQTIVLALGAFPVYAIARFFLTSLPYGKFLPLAASLAYLCNPIVQNANLFEFHMLAVAVPLLLWTAYFYLVKRTAPFFFFGFLSLLVREDVALVVGMFGALYFFERYAQFAKLRLGEKGFFKESYHIGVHLIRAKQTIFFGMLPIIAGILWFVFAQWGISNFRPAGGYAFWRYYAWIGDANFLQFIRHVFSLTNITMSLAILLMVGMLPLFNLRYLILTLPILLQNILLFTGGGKAILDSHHGLLFVPGIMVAAITGLARVVRMAPEWKQRNLLRHGSYFWEVFWFFGKEFPLPLIFIGCFYMTVVAGPVWHFVAAITSPSDILAQRTDSWRLINRVPPTTPIAASYAYLPALSSRQDILSLHYAWQGHFQFGVQPFELPQSVPLAIFDTQDMFSYFSRIFWQNDAGKLGNVTQERLVAFHELLAPFAPVDHGVSGATYLLQRDTSRLLPLAALPVAALPSITDAPPAAAPVTVLGLSKDTALQQHTGSAAGLQLTVYALQNLQHLEPFAWHVALRTTNETAFYETLASVSYRGIPQALDNPAHTVFASTIYLPMPQQLRDKVLDVRITPVAFTSTGEELQGLLHTEPIVQVTGVLGEPYTVPLVALTKQL